MRRSTAKATIEIPRTVWETADSKDELEDWLLSQNPKLVKSLRQIRKGEDLAGRGKSLDEVARRWNIKL